MVESKSPRSGRIPKGLVVLEIDGQTYCQDLDENGQAVFTVGPITENGLHSVKATFLGEGEFEGSRAQATGVLEVI